MERSRANVKEKIRPVSINNIALSVAYRSRIRNVSVIAMIPLGIDFNICDVMTALKIAEVVDCTKKVIID